MSGPGRLRLEAGRERKQPNTLARQMGLHAAARAVGKGVKKKESLWKSNRDFHCASFSYIWRWRNWVETQRFSQWKSILQQNLVSIMSLQIKQQFNEEGFSRQTITSCTHWLFAVGHASVWRATVINCRDVSVSYVCISKMVGQLLSWFFYLLIQK